MNVITGFIRTALLTLVFALASACQLTTAATPCHSDDDCPQKFICDSFSGYCRSAAATADAGPGDRGPADAVRSDVGAHDRAASDHAAVDRYSADRTAADDAGLAPDRQRYWTLVEDAGQPGGLHGSKAAFHRSLGQVMLYGGSTNCGTGPYSPALWRYDGSAWICECADCAPGPRWGHALVYDSANDRLLLFGGTSDGSTSKNDLWQWTRNNGFEQLTPTGPSPTPRQGVVAAYDDARHRLVVFGGVRDDTGATGELWEFAGLQWQQIAPTSPWPADRYDNGQVATYDRLSHSVVIYAGNNASGGVGLDDMWSWDGIAWTRRCTACTGSNRMASGFAYDPVTGRIVLQGGFTTGEEAGTWESTGAGFALVDPDLPPARDTAVLVYDEQRDVFVLYGGNFGGNNGNRAETYEYR